MECSFDSAINKTFFFQVLGVIKALCSMNACRHELQPIIGGGFQSVRPPRGHVTGFRASFITPPKLMRGSAGYRGPILNNESYGGNGGSFNDNRGGGYRGSYNRGYGMGSPRGRGNWNNSGNRGRY